MRTRILLLLLLLATGLAQAAEPLLRPREVVSMRIECLEQNTYQELATQWRDYNRQQPSEYACANWMYAMRYARDEHYPKHLAKSLRKYPANPTLLYLQGLELAVKYEAETFARALEHLELAHRLDPAYADPLFMLSVMYMQQGDEAALQQALQDLLSMGAISEVILDYCHNMLACLPMGSVLVTNGDNDTFPCWILQRVLHEREDVTVVNQSLLNTQWYPHYMAQRGLPLRITATELAQLRSTMQTPMSEAVLKDILQTSEAQGRPVMFAATLAPPRGLVAQMEAGKSYGLATLVQQGAHPQPFEPACWISQWRTAGMDGYALRFSSPHSGDRMLLQNYLGAMQVAADPRRVPSSETRRALFLWFTRHLAPQFPASLQQQMALIFEQGGDIPDVAKWLQEQGWKP